LQLQNQETRVTARRLCAVKQRGVLRRVLATGLVVAAFSACTKQEKFDTNDACCTDGDPDGAAQKGQEGSGGAAQAGQGTAGEAQGGKPSAGGVTNPEGELSLLWEGLSSPDLESRSVRLEHFDTQGESVGHFDLAGLDPAGLVSHPSGALTIWGNHCDESATVCFVRESADARVSKGALEEDDWVDAMAPCGRGFVCLAA
jgi:hypothetical protein